MMKRPEELDADTLWKILGEYTREVQDAEGISFASGLQYEEMIHLAGDQFWDTYYDEETRDYKNVWGNND